MKALVIIAALLVVGCTSSTSGPASKPGEGGDSGGWVTDDTGEGPVACTDLPARVEIGTGDSTFETLVEAEPVVMVHGPQGGWHISL